MVVKVDLEGGECGALQTGEAALFSRLKVDFLQVEAKLQKTRHCLETLAARFGYRMSPPKGHDNDTLLTRIVVADGP